MLRARSVHFTLEVVVVGWFVCNSATCMMFLLVCSCLGLLFCCASVLFFFLMSLLSMADDYGLLWAPVLAGGLVLVLGAMARGLLVLLRMIEQVQLLALLEERDTVILWQLCRTVRAHYMDVNFWIFLVDHPAVLRMIEDQIRDGLRDPLDYSIGEAVRLARR